MEVGSLKTRQRNKEKRLEGEKESKIESWQEIQHDLLFNEDIKTICKANFIGFFFPGLDTDRTKLQDKIGIRASGHQR